MAQHPSVSIVIPCFNAAETLEETLASAAMQGNVCDVAFVDDGSDDASLAVAKRSNLAMSILSQANQGVSSARNLGIESTACEWLLFLDADDALTPGTLEQRLAVARETGADVVICDWLELRDDGAGAAAPGERRRLNWNLLQADPEIATAAYVWAPPAAILYRRALVEKIGGFRSDLPIVQDARYLFDAAFHGARFAHAPHIGAHYRVRPNSLSRAQPGRFWRDILANGRQIEALWRQRGALDEMRAKALADMYNNAARGLFTARDATYFDALAAQRALGGRSSLHARLAQPVAKIVGLAQTQRLFALLRRG
jgi:glycosyltransferase involved in cell wall biosynthesis